jgi:mono/diheme cytochrome c family protein
MKKTIFLFLITATALITSCKGPKREPGSVYMPDMAYSRAYESYPELNPKVFTDKENEAGGKIYYDRKPVAGAVKQGQTGVYHGTNDSLGVIASSAFVNPMPTSSKAELTESERLYKIYCAICHGEKLDGQGPIVANGKYSVAAANLMDLAKFGKTAYPDGKIFHTLTYGKGQMGSYASQLNNKQRWMVTNYIRSKQDTTTGVKPEMAVSTKATTVTTTTVSKPDTSKTKVITAVKIK